MDIENLDPSGKITTEDLINAADDVDWIVLQSPEAYRYLLKFTADQTWAGIEYYTLSENELQQISLDNDNCVTLSEDQSLYIRIYANNPGTFTLCDYTMEVTGVISGASILPATTIIQILLCKIMLFIKA